VDYDARARLLKECDDISPAAVLRDWDSGLPKLWMIARVLKFRNAQPQLFSADAQYQPMSATGARLSNLFSCRRGDELIAAVPRFGMSVAGDWQDTQLPLPKGEWRNLFSGVVARSSVPAAQLFADFPVAVLTRAAVASR
jgi:(1->4)-alpha-D-glucan 1-alpha-D-glucosylmutase